MFETEMPFGMMIPSPYPTFSCGDHPDCHSDEGCECE